MRIRNALLAAAGAAAIITGAALPAAASTGPGDSPHASSPGHFTYTDGLNGTVTCNEVHHPSDNLPADLQADINTQLPPVFRATTGGYDTITCQLDNPTAFIQAHEGQTLYSGWISDFGGQFDHNIGVIQEKVNPAGTVIHGIAWYPFG